MLNDRLSSAGSLDGRAAEVGWMSGRVWQDYQMDERLDERPSSAGLWNGQAAVVAR